MEIKKVIHIFDEISLWIDTYHQFLAEVDGDHELLMEVLKSIERTPDGKNYQPRKGTRLHKLWQDALEAKSESSELCAV